MPKPVLLVRPESSSGDNQRDAEALAELGIASVIDPFLKVHTSKDATEARQLSSQLNQAQWLVFTSARAVHSLIELVGASELTKAFEQAADLHFGFVGQNTRAAFESEFNFIVDANKLIAAPAMTSESLARAIVAHNLKAGKAPGLVLFPQSKIALPTIREILSNAGFQVTTAVVYETEPIENPASVAGLVAGEFSAVLLRSPSAVWAVKNACSQINAKIVTTAGATLQAAKDAGLQVDRVSEGPSANQVAQAVKLAIEKPSSRVNA